jgi:hypothetical protein
MQREGIAGAAVIAIGRNDNNLRNSGQCLGKNIDTGCKISIVIAN